MINKLNRILKAFIWRYKDFLFNLELLTPSSILKYYFFLVFRIKYVLVTVKERNIKFLIRVNNKIDRSVLDYVFCKKYHLPPKEISFKEDLVIVDLGSNIGCTLVDFKSRFPKAKIYGYEMHPENFEMAKRNCEEFDSIYIKNMAVWINKGYVSFNKRNLSDAYAISKDEIEKGDEIEIASLRIEDIISDNNLLTIDFLKMDIEGAEVEIFNAKPLNWLNRVSAMNIEFHNITNVELLRYIELFEEYNFKVYKSAHHWFSILAYKMPSP